MLSIVYRFIFFMVSFLDLVFECTILDLLSLQGLVMFNPGFLHDCACWSPAMSVSCSGASSGSEEVF